MCVYVCVNVCMCVWGALEDHQLGPEMMATLFFKKMYDLQTDAGHEYKKMWLYHSWQCG